MGARPYRSQHFKDVAPEPTEYLLHCAFRASLSIESAGRFTRLAVEQTGLYPIYSPKYLVNRPVN